MLYELACLIRDILVIKTAPNSGITMLSGVASDQEVLELSKQLSSGELVRMMQLIQQTLSDFVRSDSRRMDAELCIMELCQPELSLDAKSLNARLTRLEDQIKSGGFVVSNARPAEAHTPASTQMEVPADEPEMSVPQEPVPDDVPLGFWQDLVAAVRQELKPPISGFFVSTENAPVRGVMIKGVLELRCKNSFTAEMIGKSETLEIVSRKASAQLGRPVKVITVDLTAKPSGNSRMESLLNFGRNHSDIVNMKE